ncbi:MAG: YigZ family protein [Methylococcales bacterium]
MKCVDSIYFTEEIIKKSRFVGIIAPCNSEHDIAKALTIIQQQHPTANHLAFAFRITTPKGIIYRFHDAGEPSGTAGKPIFKHLEGKDLINTLIAVVRYFGGIKLGAGGLTRAYGNSARQAIEGSSIVPYVEYQNIRLNLDYNQLKPLDYQLKQLKGTIIEQNFSDKVEILVQVPADYAEMLVEQFSR